MAESKDAKEYGKLESREQKVLSETGAQRGCRMKEGEGGRGPGHESPAGRVWYPLRIHPKGNGRLMNRKVTWSDLFFRDCFGYLM